MNKNEKDRNFGLTQVEISENIAREARDCLNIAPLIGRTRTMLLALLLCIGVYPLHTIAAGNVVLWNKLGSDTEINQSEIGPGGEKTGGYFAAGPFPDFGQAYVNDIPSLDYYSYTLSFPAKSVVSESKGTIAFWAKLNNFPNNLFEYVGLLYSYSAAQWRIGFTSNDGCGGGGLHGTVGLATDSYCHGLVDTATQEYWQSGTLDNILGDRTAWHHYAMVWDETGISQLGGRKVYLYIDGNLVATPYYLDQSPWVGSIPSGSRFALGFFIHITGASIAVDNLIVWDDVKTDFSDRFNENPVGQTFSTFIPSASMKLGPKSHDDSFKVSAKFGLGAENDGIDPVSEKVEITMGSFSTTIPAGEFQQQGLGLFTFEGTINKVDLKAQIHMPQNSSHVAAKWFKLEATGADLDGTVILPEVKLTIGDDTGQAKLNGGKAQFGQGKDDEHKENKRKDDDQWLSGATSR